MRKTLFTTLTGMLALVLPVFVNADELTEPAHKAALIEDFTGIHCSNCPRGHSISAGMLQEHYDDVVVVGLHTGSFAQPMQGEPDFRLDECESYMNRFNISSFPTALVNRAPYNNNYTLGTNLWEKAARIQVDQIADVNLRIDRAEFDVNTRVLKVKISGCFTAEPPVDPLITIWLTQSGLYGPQTGANMGSNYMHEHVLRMVLTDKWGDALPAITKGQVFTFEKDFVLPQSVREIPLTPGELELVAFVSQQKREILNVTKAHLTYPGYNPAPEVRLRASLETVPNRYGWKFIDIRLTNLSNQTINDLELNVAENPASGASLRPEDAQQWTGEIAPYHTAVIRLPMKADTDHTAYSIVATKLNGADVKSNTLTGSFRVVNVESPVNPTLEFSTMSTTLGHTWSILDDEGNTVQTFGPYDTNTKTYKQVVGPLEPGRIYCVEIRDDWGGSVNQGAKLLGESNNQLLEILGGYCPAVRGFFRVAGNVGLDDVEVADQDVLPAYYDLTGRRVLNPTAGQLLIRVAGSKVEKILFR